MCLFICICMRVYSFDLFIDSIFSIVSSYVLAIFFIKSNQIILSSDETDNSCVVSKFEFGVGQVGL